MKKYVIILCVFLTILNSPIFGQIDSVGVNSKIRLQRYMWVRTTFIYRGEAKPVGKYYSNLLPIMKNTPEAYLELKEGICIISNNRPYSYTVLLVSFATNYLIDKSKTQDKNFYKNISYPLTRREIPSPN